MEVLSVLLWYFLAPTLSFLFLLALGNQLNMGMCRCTRKMKGRSAIVTGANVGMGLETATELARRGCRVYVACRREVHGEPNPRETMANIRRETGNQQVFFLELDVSKTASVRSFVREYLERERHLDVLVNNAGMLGGGDKRRETDEGLELVTATNYLGPFLLTRLLSDALRSVGGRVINISSISNVWSALDLDDMNYDHHFPAPYQHAHVYANTKLCMAMFTKELGDREPDLTVASVSPGIVGTMIMRDFPALQRGLDKIFPVFFKSAWQGAQTAIHLALAPKVKSGVHYADCRKSVFLNSRVNSREERKKLWKETEKLLKKKGLLNLD